MKRRLLVLLALLAVVAAAVVATARVHTAPAHRSADPGIVVNGADGWNDGK